MKNIALFVIFILIASSANARDIKNLPITFREPEVMGIELLTNRLDIGTVDPFKSFKEIPEGIKLKVNSNVNWVLYVMVNGDFVNGRGDRIPSDRFEIRTLGGKFHPLKRGEMYKIASRGDRCVLPDGVINIDVMFKLNMNDSPGDYSGNLNFILERNF